MNISNNISSLFANQTFWHTGANNIVNVNTDGFRPQDTRITNASGSPEATTRITDNNGSTKSRTDLAKEIPDLIVSSGVAEENVAVIKTQDEMFGTLLDIKG